MRLHPYRIDDRVRAATVGQLAHHVRKIIFVLSQIDNLYAASTGPLQPGIYQVNGNNCVDPLLLSDPAGHVADWSQPQDQQRTSIWHCRVLHRLPCGRQHIG